jgi:hypothetical protein
VKSCDNLADVFTKVVAPPIFEKMYSWTWHEKAKRNTRIRGRTP